MRHNRTVNDSKIMPKKIDVKLLGRVVKQLFSYYPVMMPISVACIIFSAIVATIPAIFLEKVTAAIDAALKTGTAWEAAKGDIIP